MYLTLVCMTVVAVLAGLVIATIGRRRRLLTPAQRQYCPFCKLQPKIAFGCTWNRNNVITFADGKKLAPIPWSGVTICPGCLAHAGHYHHPGCPNEECPQCHGLLNDCDCRLMRR